MVDRRDRSDKGVLVAGQCQGGMIIALTREVRYKNDGGLRAPSRSNGTRDQVTLVLHADPWRWHEGTRVVREVHGIAAAGDHLHGGRPGGQAIAPDFLE